jgi:hypothetical protein
MGIPVVNTPRFPFYIEWFTNNNGNVLRCERSWKGPGCGEVARTFIYQNGIWVDSGDEELIVCGLFPMLRDEQGKVNPN